ncbi:hypothetical protein SADUNF_Sadunf17G0096100 [Salix dunnii]|uniref:Uncharacterized protein n=1 Tax=Salix dunnii TaxID=1413687 RepID=A0A835MEU8_9ROSI|nr:hypothetical protein SADUNF_Sadunf17G0096100 [Salix dunnii]
MGETGMTLKELRRVFPSPPIPQISSSSSLDLSSPLQQLWIAKIYHPASMSYRLAAEALQFFSWELHSMEGLPTSSSNSNIDLFNNKNM